MLRLLTPVTGRTHVVLASSAHARTHARTAAVYHIAVQVCLQQGDSVNNSDGVIGIAQVELSLLHIMGHVSGWYNIINARYNPRLALIFEILDSAQPFWVYFYSESAFRNLILKFQKVSA